LSLVKYTVIEIVTFDKYYNDDLETHVRGIQGRWKWHRSIHCILLLTFTSIVTMALSCTVFDIIDFKQESPAVTDKTARRESMPKIAPIWRAYNIVADNTGLSSFVQLLLRLKPAKSREILWKFKLINFKVIQGHRSWCQSKVHMQLPISH